MNSYKEEMIFYIKSHQNEFEELISLALSNKQPYSWRAAWLLWACMEDNDKRIRKHIKKIITILHELKDGHQRNLFNVLLKMEIDQEYEGQLFDTCINIWTKIDKQPSVRCKSFEIIMQITKRYPELYNEIIPLTESQYLETLSGGIKNSMFRIIKEFKKDNNIFKD